MKSRAAIRLATMVAVVFGTLTATPAAPQQNPALRAVEPDVMQPRRTPTPTPPKGPVIEDVETPEAEPQPTFSFTLTGVEVVGVTVYPREDIAAIYTPFLARQITVTDVERIVQAIARRYRRDGYLLSRAVAPPQDLEFGVLRIEVREGFVDKVTFTGGADGDSRLRAYADKIQAERPLQRATLERYVLLIDDLPGVTARPFLRRLEDDNGAHELVVELTHDKADAYLSIDNKGTRPVGRHIVQLTGGLNSYLQHNERLDATVYTVPDDPEELKFVEGRLTYPLGTEGTTITFDGWYSLIESGSHLAPLDLDSRERRIGVDISHPIMRERQRSLYLTATFEYRNTEETFQGVNLFNDRTRSVRIALRGYLTDILNGENLVTIRASKGFDTLGASSNEAPNLSRLGGKTDYSRLEADYVRWQDLPGAFSAMFGLRGQLAADGLLSGEEFRAGGGNFGRAYDPSEIAGEEGIAGFIELRGDIDTAGAGVRAIQAFAFYDLAAAWDDDPVNGTAKRSIASLGAGLRATLPYNIRTTVELAKPLTSSVLGEGQDGDDVRAFFSLSKEF